MYYGIITLLIAIDQGIKFVVASRMRLGESIPVIEDFLHITYIRNSGGAFGIMQGQTAILTLIPALLTIGFLVYIYKKRKSEKLPYLLSLSLIAAGGIGNLIDRIRFGEVVDFIDFRVFPIFNFADICVCCGCALLLYVMLYEKPTSD